MRPRPLVDLAVPTPHHDLLARFRARLQAPDCPCEGHVGQRELSLAVRGPRRFWSPWVSLETWEWAGGTRLRGHIGPHPSAWGMFVGLYAAQVFAFIGGGIYGYVQWALGDAATGAWVAGGALGGLAISCGVDLVGRSWAAPQMQTLRTFVDETLPEAIPLPEDAPLPSVRSPLAPREAAGGS